MSLGVSLPNPLNASRDAAAALESRGLPRRALIAVVVWPVAAWLAWSLMHPDYARLRAEHLAIGMDGHAYWMAWRHQQMYGLAPRALDAYLYSPAFAQVLWPLTRMGFAAFAAVWWSAIVATFWWLLRPLPWWWRLPAFVACGFELQVGNIYAFVALMLVLALRRPQVWAFGLLTKVTLGIGLVWHLARREWDALARASLTTAAVATCSAVLAPGLWAQWLQFLVTSQGASSLASVLDPRSLPMRVLAATGLIVWGARTNRRWVLGVAVPLASPLIGLATLTVLASLPRLVVDGRNARRTAVGTVDLAHLIDTHLPHESLPGLGTPDGRILPAPAAGRRSSISSRRQGANA